MYVTGRYNTLRPRQNGRHFPDDIVKWIFLNENACISIKISIKMSSKFVSRVAINIIPALVHIMAWCQPGIDASLGLNELSKLKSKYKKNQIF